MPTKLLRVLGHDGAGKKTLIGILSYKCGLGFPDIELLEKNGIRDYDEIVSFFNEKGMALSFYSPAAKFVVEEKEVPDIHIVFWVVDATAADKGSDSSKSLESLLSAGELRPQERLVILVNKMDLIDWSEKVFGEVARAFNRIGQTIYRTSIIPISSLQGVNLFEPPGEPSWIGAVPGSCFEGSGLVCGRSLMLELR